MGMLALTIAGCGSGSEENSAVTPSAPSFFPKPFDKPPMVTQNPAGTIASVPGLIHRRMPTSGQNKCKKGVQIHLRCFSVETVPNAATPQNCSPATQPPF